MFYLGQAIQRLTVFFPSSFPQSTTLLLMIEETSVSKLLMGFSSLSLSIRAMIGLMAEVQCPTSKLTSKCTTGLRET